MPLYEITPVNEAHSLYMHGGCAMHACTFTKSPLSAKHMHAHAEVGAAMHACTTCQCDAIAMQSYMTYTTREVVSMPTCPFTKSPLSMKHTVCTCTCTVAVLCMPAPSRNHPCQRSTRACRGRGSHACTTCQCDATAMQSFMTYTTREVVSMPACRLTKSPLSMKHTVCTCTVAVLCMPAPSRNHPCQRSTRACTGRGSHACMQDLPV